MQKPMTYWILAVVLVVTIAAGSIYVMQHRDTVLGSEQWKEALLDAAQRVAEAGAPWTKESIEQAFSISLARDVEHSNTYFTVYTGRAESGNPFGIEQSELRLPVDGGDTDAIIILTLVPASAPGQMLTLGDFQKRYASAGVENELPNVSYESPSQHYYSIRLPDGTKVKAGTKTAEVLVEPDPATPIFSIIITR